VAEFGSPLFVFSERTLAARYRELHDAFTRHYPRVRIAWSYKTNYLEAICRVLHREGAWAEVVSPFEFEKAIGAGVPADRIHFNGPYKPDDALERAIAGGATLHIDNFDEIVRIENVARKTGKRPRVAVRVNMAIDGLEAWSRFGLNLESGHAADAVKRILRADRMDLVGLHTHIGTFILEPSMYGAAATKLAHFANDLRAQHGLTLSFLDLGGGFASPNTLKGQYPLSDWPTLVLETGRALVDEAGYLVCTVQATKRQTDGQRALVLDAGVNILFTSFWYNHDAVPMQEFRGSPEPTVLYGPLCMNIDVLRESIQLPPLSVGDRIVFRNVGAYNLTQSMQFITLRPAVVLVGAGGSVACIRRAETVALLCANEEVPAWLR
jgi:diaminopimelate decarboxylase